MTWLVALASVEGLAVSIAMARWARRWAAGMYTKTSYVGLDEDANAFLSHLTLGLLWPLGLPILVGIGLHQRDERKAKEEKRLAAEERELERMLRS